MQRRIFLAAWALGLTKLVWAQPDNRAPVSVEDIQVRWTRPEPDGVNLRVTVANLNPISVEDPISLKLFIRGDSDQAWRLLQRWPDIPRLPAYYRESRDYLPHPHQPLDPALRSGHFQLQAVAELGFGRRAVRETSFAFDPSKIVTDGSNPDSPIRVTKLSLQDTTPYYLDRPDLASSLGEVRVYATVRNTGPSALTELVIRLRVETQAGQLVEEFTENLARLEANRDFEYSSPSLRNYSLAQLRAVLTVQHDR